MDREGYYLKTLVSKIKPKVIHLINQETKRESVRLTSTGVIFIR